VLAKLANSDPFHVLHSSILSPGRTTGAGCSRSSNTEIWSPSWWTFRGCRQCSRSEDAGNTLTGSSARVMSRHERIPWKFEHLADDPRRSDRRGVGADRRSRSALLGRWTNGASGEERSPCGRRCHLLRLCDGGQWRALPPCYPH
jgi:hypothetical protein